MKNHILLMMLIFTPLINAFAQDLKDMNFDQLRTNCVKEIETGYDTKPGKIKVVDFKILAWYRMRDNRPWYVDNALCWAKTTTRSGDRWALVHMARNPTRTGQPVIQAWHSYTVTDVQNGWFIYFNHPPKNDEVYGSMRWFLFAVPRDWTMYDSKLLEENWESAIGEKPTVKFSRD
jgi:hypothetical protein